MLLNALCSELGDKMAFGGKLTLLGIAIVFVLLGLIVIILTVMERINKKLAGKPKSEKKSLKDLFKKKGAEPETLDKPVVENIIIDDEVKNSNDDEVIAAIMGALSVVLDDEGNDSKFVVKKINKLSFRR